MNFNDIQVIWDSQNQQRLYAVDEAGLHACVERCSRRFNRSILLRDVREIGLGSLITLAVIIEAVKVAVTGYGFVIGSQAEADPMAAWLLFAAVPLAACMPVYMLVTRRRQRRREQQYEHSLKGDLGKAVSQIHFQIRLIGTIPWWGIIPTFTGCSLILYAISVLESDSRREMLYIVGLAVIPAGFLAVFCNRKMIQKKLLPRKRELESLRDKLAG